MGKRMQLWKEVHFGFRREYLLRLKELNLDTNICIQEWLNIIGCIANGRIIKCEDLTYDEMVKMHEYVFDLVKPDYIVAFKYGVSTQDLYSLNYESIKKRKILYNKKPAV